MSAVRRVRTLLQQVDKRAAQSASDRTDQGDDRILNSARKGIQESKKEAVTIKGTGRAIEKVLNLAAWFDQRQIEEGVKVRLATNSAVAIDDIEYNDEIDNEPTENSQLNQDLPESRLRHSSVLEVIISLR
jgi:ribonuclease P/MRP protein subunit POP7